MFNCTFTCLSCCPIYMSNYEPAVSVVNASTQSNSTAVSASLVFVENQFNRMETVEGQVNQGSSALTKSDQVAVATHVFTQDEGVGQGQATGAGLSKFVNQFPPALAKELDSMLLGSENRDNTSSPPPPPPPRVTSFVMPVRINSSNSISPSSATEEVIDNSTVSEINSNKEIPQPPHNTDSTSSSRLTYLLSEAYKLKNMDKSKVTSFPNMSISDALELKRLLMENLYRKEGEEGEEGGIERINKLVVGGSEPIIDYYAPTKTPNILIKGVENLRTPIPSPSAGFLWV